MRYAVILAGGSGTRLWPLSRRSSPKQVRALLDEETLLQKTYRRVRQVFPVDAVFVAMNAEHEGEVGRQLPELPNDHRIVEPVARDTAAAIGYAALRLQHRDPDAIMTTVSSDSYVEDTSNYLRAIVAAQETIVSSGGDVALIGIAPTYPETGYGYIELQAPVASRTMQPLPVVRFVEKPDAATAERFLQSGRYLWNPSLFTFRAQRFLELIAEHLPYHAQALASINDTQDANAVTRAFLAMPKIAVEYGVLERLHSLVVVPVTCGWADVGHWRAVHEILSKDPNADVVRGMHVGVEGNGNLVVAPPGKLVATYGLEHCVIIDTNDALLICPRDRAQDVKKVVEELERRGLTEYL